jgi:predicted nucleic acid-binding protein
VAKPVLLDTGPLGKLVHPKKHRDLGQWFSGLAGQRVQIVIPEIADYELRRNLLLESLAASVQRLDQLGQQLIYLPISTAHIRKAAELWAAARASGLPTADDKALDGDVILAAQALSIGGVVATENVAHLSRLCDARNWKGITAESLGE